MKFFASFTSHADTHKPFIIYLFRLVLCGFIDDVVDNLAMTRIDFYLNASSKVEVARKLASKALHAGSHILVFTRDLAHARDVDDYFWSSHQLSFLPHVLCGHRLANKTPILIGDDPEKLLLPDVLINLADITPDCFSRFDRLLEIVAEDEGDKERARGRFRYFKERGYSLEVHDLKTSQ